MEDKVQKSFKKSGKDTGNPNMDDDEAELARRLEVKKST